MTIFDQIALRIIKEQELIIGPMAWEEAKKVPGLTIVNTKEGNITLAEDKKIVIDNLIRQYERLFGRASREACREAVFAIVAGMPPSEVPVSLR